MVAWEYMAVVCTVQITELVWEIKLLWPWLRSGKSIGKWKGVVCMVFASTCFAALGQGPLELIADYPEDRILGTSREQHTLSPCFFGKRLSIYALGPYFFGSVQIVLSDMACLRIVFFLMEQAACASSKASTLASVYKKYRRWFWFWSTFMTFSMQPWGFLGRNAIFCNHWQVKKGTFSSHLNASSLSEEEFELEHEVQKRLGDLESYGGDLNHSQWHTTVGNNTMDWSIDDLYMFTESFTPEKFVVSLYSLEILWWMLCEGLRMVGAYCFFRAARKMRDLPCSDSDSTRMVQIAKETMRVGVVPMIASVCMSALYMISLVLQLNIKSEAVRQETICIVCVTMWTGLCFMRLTLIRNITAARFTDVAETTARYTMLFESGALGNAVEGDTITDCATFVREGLRRCKGVTLGQISIDSLRPGDTSCTAQFAGKDGTSKRVEATACEAPDFFVSHSWHDDVEAKWTALCLVATVFRLENNGREPIFWIDKFCIDQDNIAVSLRYLPVFVNACHKQLVLNGNTYFSRLWCVWELFVMSCGDPSLDRVLFWTLDGRDINGVREELESFRFQQVQCFKEEDKAKILGIVHSALKGGERKFCDIMRKQIPKQLLYTAKATRGWRASVSPASGGDASTTLRSDMSESLVGSSSAHSAVVFNPMASEFPPHSFTAGTPAHAPHTLTPEAVDSEEPSGPPPGMGTESLGVPPGMVPPDTEPLGPPPP